MEMGDQDRMSREKKIKVSAIACVISIFIAAMLNGTLTDKVLWFIEITGFSLFAIWTIW
jgi:hypothetical protein